MIEIPAFDDMDWPKDPFYLELCLQARLGSLHLLESRMRACVSLLSRRAEIDPPANQLGWPFPSRDSQQTPEGSTTEVLDQNRCSSATP